MGFVKKFKNGSPYERIWWASVLFMCSFLCGHLIYTAWKDWNQTPAIVSNAESLTPVWKVPFPAVTICSETKSRKDVFSFTDMYHKFREQRENMTNEEFKQYETMSLLCDSFLMQQGQNFTNSTSVDFLMKAAPEFHSTFSFCKWKNLIFNCSKVFNPVFTDDGLCYVFNALTVEEMFRQELIQNEYSYIGGHRHSEGWSLDKGYPPNTPMKTYPIRAGSGTNEGLTVVLKTDIEDLDYVCRGPIQGFKVSLHTPVEYPTLINNYFRVPLSQEVIAHIKPSMLTTSEKLITTKPQKRKCFFPSERTLKYYKTYTQRNCELECLTNYTLAFCGCVKFYMPRNASTPICASGSTKCTNKAAVDLLARIMKKHEGTKIMNSKPEDKNKDEIVGQCDCLPACTSIGYDVEVSQATFEWSKVYSSFREETTKNTGINMAKLMLYIKESHFTASTRTQSHSETYFLAICGGLLALCLGFSLLTLCEFLYQIIRKMYIYIKEKLWRKKVAPHNNLENVNPTDIIAEKY